MALRSSIDGCGLKLTVAAEVELERGFCEIAGLIGVFGTDGTRTSAIRTETLRLDAPRCYLDTALDYVRPDSPNIGQKVRQVAISWHPIVSGCVVWWRVHPILSTWRSFPRTGRLYTSTLMHRNRMHANSTRWCSAEPLDPYQLVHLGQYSPEVSWCRQW